MLTQIKSGTSAVKFGIFALMLGTAALAFPFSHANAIELYGGFTFGNTEWEFDREPRPFAGEVVEPIRTERYDNRTAMDDRGMPLNEQGQVVQLLDRGAYVFQGDYTRAITLNHTVNRRAVDGAGEGFGFHVGRVVYDGVVKVGVEGFFADLGEATAPTTISETYRVVTHSGTDDPGETPPASDRGANFTTRTLQGATLNGTGQITNRPAAITGTDVLSAKTYGIAARVSYQLNDVLDVYGRLGMHKWSSSRNGPTARFFFTEDDGLDPVYGVGLKYKPDPNGNGYTELGYDIYHLEDDMVAKAYLGVGVALKN